MPRTTHRSRSRLALLTAALTLGAQLFSPAQAYARTFTPERIISNANMRAYTSMSANQIQRFLDSKPGPLKTLFAQRHDNGSVARASVIIYEACQAWRISPKVMLTMLQKEQSLLTRTTLARNTLARAVGAGCPDSVTNRYPGFGNQIWHGARLLDGYGEEGKTTEYVPHPWVPGMVNSFTGPVSRTDNIATYKLYVYNPSIGARAPYGDLSRQACSGNANFWKIYWAYFGDPFAGPADVPGPWVPPATEIRLPAQFSRTVFGTPVTLAGRLDTSPTVTVEGSRVRLERLGGSVWSVVPGSERAVGPDGSFAYPLSPWRADRVRVSFAGTGTLPPAASGLFVSDIASVLTTPTQVGRATATIPAVVRGNVTPGHAGYVSVRLFSMATGTPVVWRTYTIKTAYNGAWAMRVGLARGTWKVLASHLCADHAIGFSPLGTIVVR